MSNSKNFRGPQITPFHKNIDGRTSNDTSRDRPRPAVRRTHYPARYRLFKGANTAAKIPDNAVI